MLLSPASSSDWPAFQHVTVTHPSFYLPFHLAIPSGSPICNFISTLPLIGTPETRLRPILSAVGPHHFMMWLCVPVYRYISLCEYLYMHACVQVPMEARGQP